MNQLSKTITASLTVSLILAVPACSTVHNSSAQDTQNQYKYAHKCTFQGQPVTRFITAAVPLTTDVLASLRQSLEENFQLDYQSCVYIESTHQN